MNSHIQPYYPYNSSSVSYSENVPLVSRSCGEMVSKWTFDQKNEGSLGQGLTFAFFCFLLKQET